VAPRVLRCNALCCVALQRGVLRCVAKRCAALQRAVLRCNARRAVAGFAAVAAVLGRCHVALRRTRRYTLPSDRAQTFMCFAAVSTRRCARAPLEL
jgi:hypothetical protein